MPSLFTLLNEQQAVGNKRRREPIERHGPRLCAKYCASADDCTCRYRLDSDGMLDVDFIANPRVKAANHHNATAVSILKLPTEIRWQIWELVLGGQHIHLRRDAPTRGGKWCNQCAPLDEAWPLKKGLSPNARQVTLASSKRCSWRERRLGPRDDQIPGSVRAYLDDLRVNDFTVQLLRVCRAIYSEARLMPYSRNVFSAYDDGGFHEGAVWGLLPVQQGALRAIVCDKVYDLDVGRNLWGLRTVFVRASDLRRRTANPFFGARSVNILPWYSSSPRGIACCAQP